MNYKAALLFSLFSFMFWVFELYSFKYFLKTIT